MTEAQLQPPRPYHVPDPSMSLMDALHRTAKEEGYAAPVLDDPDRKAMTYGDLLIGSYALGSALAKITGRGEHVGHLLPTSIGGSVAFWALVAFGRVPAMLNARTEAADLLAQATVAGLRLVVTSHRFARLAGLGRKMEALALRCRIVYLEDLREEIGLSVRAQGVLQKLKGLRSKLAGLLHARSWLPRPARKLGDEPAVIIFTAGSEGLPKGVVLSSFNLLSNVAQVRAVTPLSPSDRVFNAMPLFHSFGLTAGLLIPLLSGIRSYQYPSPLDARVIPKLVREEGSTIMFGTNTFLKLYASCATPGDFARLAQGMVFAGAEALSAEVSDLYLKKFGITIYQGYGTTETAPVIAMSAPGKNRPGFVGKFLPEIETRFEDVAGVKQGRRLYVRGPNVMLGYLSHEKPGALQKPLDGWHDTGDIISVSEDGFVKVEGRAGRFAKFGGEMVALDAIERLAGRASPTHDHAVILHLAENERAILFTTDETLRRDLLVKAAREMQTGLLGIPRNGDIRLIESIPKLPTGKTDYEKLKRLYATMTSDSRAEASGRFINS